MVPRIQNQRLRNSAFVSLLILVGMLPGVPVHAKTVSMRLPELEIRYSGLPELDHSTAQVALTLGDHAEHISELSLKLTVASANGLWMAIDGDDTTFTETEMSLGGHIRTDENPVVTRESAIFAEGVGEYTLRFREDLLDCPSWDCLTNNSSVLRLFWSGEIAPGFDPLIWGEVLVLRATLEMELRSVEVGPTTFGVVKAAYGGR